MRGIIYFSCILGRGIEEEEAMSSLGGCDMMYVS
jgi:hypothetical protein